MNDFILRSLWGHILFLAISPAQWQPFDTFLWVGNFMLQEAPIMFWFSMKEGFYYNVSSRFDDISAAMVWFSSDTMPLGIWCLRSTLHYIINTCHAWPLYFDITTRALWERSYASDGFISRLCRKFPYHFGLPTIGSSMRCISKFPRRRRLSTLLHIIAAKIWYLIAKFSALLPLLELFTGWLYQVTMGARRRKVCKNALAAFDRRHYFAFLKVIAKINFII